MKTTFQAVLIVLVIVAAFAFAHDKKKKEKMPASTAPAVEIPKDPHSFSNPQQVVVRHIDLDLNVDFAKKQLAGTATLTLENKTGGEELILDTRDLTITKVTRGGKDKDTPFTLGEAQATFGAPLKIQVGKNTDKVTVHYSTSPDAAAVQWLTPEQTAGKKHPFLFTQSQAILARTWAPVQDSPAVRMTYTAKIRVPKELMAVMSAENPTEKNANGVYTFKQEKPIPSYLLALAVGDIAFRKIGPNTGVYAEPSVVEKAAWEFADVDKMMKAAEALYGPYRWGQYDLLVLPPSFPYGGMENPRLTFATPTLLAGDRSLVSVVAHELAHSWSGNLVTNATWNDFWLNEGFTTYFEHRIMEAVYGRDYAEMLSKLSYQDLERSIESAGATSRDTWLRGDYAGRDPDEAASQVAYNKGYFFLRKVEESAGRERFDAFLRSYFDTFAFQSMTTDGFLAYLDKNLIKGDEKLAAAINIPAWIDGPGIPANISKIDAKLLNDAAKQLEAFNSGAPAASLKTEKWSSAEWLFFLRGLPKTISAERMAELDKQFKLTQSGNAEIVDQWFLRAIQSNYKPAFPAMENFLTTVGRMKFVRPLYAELAKTPENKAWGERVFAKAKAGYHPLTAATSERALKGTSPSAN